MLRPIGEHYLLHEGDTLRSKFSSAPACGSDEELEHCPVSRFGHHTMRRCR
jgi:hypothetical protein